MQFFCRCLLMDFSVASSLDSDDRSTKYIAAKVLHDHGVRVYLLFQRHVIEKTTVANCHAEARQRLSGPVCVCIVLHYSFFRMSGGTTVSKRRHS